MCGGGGSYFQNGNWSTQPGASASAQQRLADANKVNYLTNPASPKYNPNYNPTPNYPNPNTSNQNGGGSSGWNPGGGGWDGHHSGGHNGNPNPTPTPVVPPPLSLGNWGDLDRQWQLYSRDPDSFAPGTDMVQARQNFIGAGGYGMPFNSVIPGIGANVNGTGGGGWLGNLTRNIGGPGSALPTPVSMV